MKNRFIKWFNILSIKFNAIPYNIKFFIILIIFMILSSLASYNVTRKTYKGFNDTYFEYVYHCVQDLKKISQYR